MRALQFFLVRQTTEYYTVVVEDTKEAARANLEAFFAEVRFVKAEALNWEGASKFLGSRILGEGIIRGCYYTRSFGTLVKNTKPIEAEQDSRYAG